MAPRSTLILTSFALTLVVNACKKDEATISTEKVGAPNGAPSMTMPSMPTTPQGNSIDSNVMWKLPSHWNSKREAGIRIASFWQDTDSSTQISLSYIPGEAGELNSNIHRWMKQAKIQLATDEYQSFLEQYQVIHTQGKWQGQFFDFTKCPSPAGLLVIQFREKKGTYFLKIMTSLEIANKLKPQFIEIAQSLGGMP